MMNIEDEKPEEIKTALEIKNEALYNRISELETLKKEKLKELRERRK